MPEKELKMIADQANMIVKGYAFTYRDGNVSVLNLNKLDRAVLMSKDGKVLESNTDAIEEALILKIWNEDKEFMENRKRNKDCEYIRGLCHYMPSGAHLY